MAKAQGKKAAAAKGKNAVKKVAAQVKKAATAAKKKIAPKKAAPKPAPKKVVSKKPLPKKAAPKKAAPAKPVKTAPKKTAASTKKAVKAVGKAVKAVVAKVAAKPVKPAKPVKAAPVPKAVKPAPAPGPVAPKMPAVPKPAEPEKKRGRRARPRVHSSGAPAASWLSTEKPRPASFIAAPARAEAPSAIAAPPASSDRLIREEDLAHPAVRTVPVRIDVEQGAGRFYVIANPSEVTVRVTEGIEWDFRYIGGADVTAEEVVIEFEKPSPFAHNVFRTRKPGGARPHRQLSGGALPAAAGKRIEYVVRAVNQFKTEMARTKVVVNVTA